MPAPLSVIIPTFNALPRLGQSVAALAEGLDTGLIAELIISDGGSVDAIETVADELGAAFLRGAKGRGQQLGAGAAMARAEWLLFLHADTVLQPGWAGAVAAHIARGPNRAACFRLRFDAPGPMARLVAGGANLRSRALGLPYGDQALLISRKLYTEIGGYKPIPLMEDVAIARALRGRLTMLPATALTAADKYQAQGWLRRAARNLWLLARYLCGAKPEKLAAAYAPSENCKR